MKCTLVIYRYIKYKIKTLLKEYYIIIEIARVVASSYFEHVDNQIVWQSP